MSDIPPGARAPSSTESGGSARETAKQVAHQGTQAAGQAASDVKETAKDQAHRVASEAKTQARSVVSDVRDRVSTGARGQNDKLVSTIRQTADQLDEMRGDRSDSPAATVVSRVADGGRQLADYLDRNGPEGVLDEVQEFARRRPGTFLATALVAGFVVGRLGKGVAKAGTGDSGETGKPRTDLYSSTSYPPAATQDVGYTTTATENVGYAGETVYTPGTSAGQPVEPAYGSGAGVSTEYAATGTGTPVVVEEDYQVERREPRP